MPDGILRPTEADAVDAWAALVDADAAQVARVREPEPRGDYYATTAARFRPGSRASLELPLIEVHARPGDTWLDIGAGGGRFAIPLSRHVARVIAIEPSEAMRGALTTAAAEAGRANIEIHDRRWPAADWTAPADVSLAAHSLYDIRAIAPFLDAMEQHTHRLCIAVFGDQPRGAHLARLFEAAHSEPLATLPALREFIALLSARGRRFDVATVAAEPEAVVSLDEAAALARRLLWLAAGSAKEQRMRSLIEAWWAVPGGIALPPGRRFLGVVSWEPDRP